LRLGAKALGAKAPGAKALGAKALGARANGPISRTIAAQIDIAVAAANWCGSERRETRANADRAIVADECTLCLPLGWLPPHQPAHCAVAVGRRQGRRMRKRRHHADGSGNATNQSVVDRDGANGAEPRLFCGRSAAAATSMVAEIFTTMSRWCCTFAGRRLTPCNRGWRVSDGVAGSANEAAVGWRFTVSVRQPNGGMHHRMWILAIADEGSARQRLRGADLPAEAEAVPLSPEEAAHFGLAAGDIRRVL
jgi:hypothetical protein